MSNILDLPVPFVPAMANDEAVEGLRKTPERLPRVDWIDRSGPVLHAGPMDAGCGVLSLNLARGCGHRCAFCSVRASPGYPAENTLYLYRDTPERLAVELAARASRPRAVYISPSSDPFPPMGSVQQEAARLVPVLASHGVTAWFMTRGLIRPSIRRTLAAHSQCVRVTVALTTLDRKLQQHLEPLTPSPRLRLRQIAELKGVGIPVQVAVEPLLPGLTDTRANLAALLGELAGLGVERISVSYMFLRSRIRQNLADALQATGDYERIAEAYVGGPMLEGSGVAGAQYLPKVRRQRGYAQLMALAADLGIRVQISGLTNPDFATLRPAGSTIRPTPRLLPLFQTA